MSAFVVSRKNVGFFGFSSAGRIALFPSKLCETSAVSIQNPVILSCGDEFPGKPTAEGNTCKLETDENGIVCATISNCGGYVAASDYRKKFYLWHKTKESWLPSSYYEVVRKAYKVIFTNSGSEALLVDRTGDVYSFAVKSKSGGGKFILGHLSIILDIAMSKDDKYIITCDRDNKIRVSNYPNCYNIVTYCFGHDEFVSSLCIINTTEERLLSGSGDGTLRVWNYGKGKMLNMTSIKDTNFKNVLPEENASMLAVKEVCAVRTLAYSPVHNVLAALFHPEPVIGVYNITDSLEETVVPVQLLHCSGTPLEARFDPQGNLWVYVLSDSESVVLFQYAPQEGVLFVKANETIPESLLVKELNEKWQHKTLPTFEIDMKHLYKQYYDDDDPVIKHEGTKCKKKKQKKKREIKE